MDIISNSQKTEVVNKIISSNTFSNSEQYCALLKFLFQNSINKIAVKEYTIGVEVFKKNNDFDPALDPSVRTFIHRLRSKILSYYESEGKHDRIVLTIPKGHYDVKFIRRSFIGKNLFNKPVPISLIFITIIIALISFYIFTVNYDSSIKNSFQIVDKPIPKDDPIWSSFFANKLRTTVVIGDHYQFVEYNDDSSKIRQIIDFSITSNEEFESYDKQNANKNLAKGWHGGLPANAVWNFYDLVHVLYSYNQQVNIELSSLFMASEFDLTNVIDRNIIYMGCFRNLRKFNNIISKLPIDYEYTNIFKGTLTIKEPGTDSLITFIAKKLDNKYHRDIGLIAKLPGNNNENYLFFVGFAFPAQIEVVKLLSSEKLLSEVYSQIPVDISSFPEYFFMVIDVYCTEFSAIETKVKYFKEIHKSSQK
jgi:hypothetical protein